MAHFRVVPAQIWSDDIFLSASPEQKLTAIYLYTCPTATQCGIYKIPIRTMGFHLGFTPFPAESALKGLCATLPEFFAFDSQTGEVALLQHPKTVLLNAGPKIMRQVVEELKNVQSKALLQQVIKYNSATMSAPYLSRLRALNAVELNTAKQIDAVNTMLHVDVVKVIENENINREIEIEKEIEKKEKRINPKSSIQILKDEQVLSALKKQFGPGVDMEIEKAIDYISARGKRYKDYVAFMRNWMRNRHKYENKQVTTPGVDYKAREQAQNYKPDVPANNMHLI